MTLASAAASVAVVDLLLQNGARPDLPALSHKLHPWYKGWKPVYRPLEGKAEAQEGDDRILTVFPRLMRRVMAMAVGGGRVELAKNLNALHKHICGEELTLESPAIPGSG